MNRTLCLILCAALLCLSATSTVVAQQVPPYINCQGRLLEGTNLVSGPVSVRLRLYTNAAVTAGEVLLYEDSNTLTAADGFYSTLLGDNRTGGSCVELREALLANPIYIETVVNSVTMAPREQLVSVGYALLPGVRGTGNVEDGLWSAVGGGETNVIGTGGIYGVIGGGLSNRVFGQGGVVPGGTSNTATGENSFASGRGARADHDHTFVWSGSQTGGVASTTNDQFVVGASNGVWIALDAGTNKQTRIGERYRDNSIVAWAKVQANGSIWQDASFGVKQVVNYNPGQYAITIDDATVAAGLGGHLIPTACCEIDGPPSSLGAVRFISIDQMDVSDFRVYINNGNGTLTNNDFTFIVTGK